MRKILAVLAIAVIGAPLAASAQVTPSAWSLTAWPAAGMLIQQSAEDGYIRLEQTIACTRGRTDIVWRRYYARDQDRPAGARKGCDARCRTDMTLTDSDAERPAGFTEQRLIWPQMRATLTSQPGVSGNLLARLTPEFAKSCRLDMPTNFRPPPAPTPVNARAVALIKDLSLATSWTPFPAKWKVLPNGPNAQELPRAFATPAVAWDYGAISEIVSTRAPAIIRLQLQGQSGRVGVALAQPDGSKLISGEHVIGPGDRATAYLRLPRGGQAAVLVRNYDAPGQAGSVMISGAEVIAEAALPGPNAGLIKAQAK